MKSRKSTSIHHPIIVGPEDLGKLDNFLRENFAELAYKADCVDGTTFETESLDRLLEYENPSFRKLKQIEIQARELLTEENEEKPSGEADLSERFRRIREGYSSTKIVLGDDTSSIYLISTGYMLFHFRDAKRQFAIEDEITKRIGAMRPWYSWLTKRPLLGIVSVVSIIMGAGITTSIALAIMSGILTLDSLAPSSSSSAKLFWALIVGAGNGILITVGALLLDRMREYFLPNCFFYIGRQKQMLEKRQNLGKHILQIVFTVIGLGIIVNLASSLIWDNISK